LQNLGTTIGELKTKSENFETVAANKQKLIEKLENDIDSKDKAYQVLQDTYNEVWAEKEKITKQFKEQEKFEAEVINTKVPELENQIKKLEAENEVLQKQYKENDIAKGEAELRAQSLNDEYTKKFEEQETQIETLKKKFNEANEKVEKLNQLYDNCENEKLAAQADYDALKEKYNELKINAEANEEVARNYDEIIDEYEQMKFFMEALQKLTESVNITWKNVPQAEVNKLKEKVKVKTEQVKKSNKEGRIINQEMAVQGGMTINM
jgi:chromosome segregation ATPase